MLLTFELVADYQSDHSIQFSCFMLICRKSVHKLSLCFKAISILSINLLHDLV